MSDIQQRKVQHIKLAQDNNSQFVGNIWDKYRLPYSALPEMDLNEVDTSVELFGKKLNQPLIIASMTGGSEHAEKINTNLAIGAEKMRVALGVGSQRVALEKEDAKRTFELVRKFAPTTVVFANMGAVQMNYGHGTDSYRRVIEMVKADGLYLHINPIQEALQPEGDTNWRGLLKKIEELVKDLPVPVWVKEVGCGIDDKTAKKLVETGVAGIDVAGVGGTSWTWIEASRRGSERLTKWFKDYGNMTDESITQLVKAKLGVPIVASGGIRSPLDGLKANMLGASWYSSARPFLDAAMESADKVIELISEWEYGLKVGMFGMGKKVW